MRVLASGNRDRENEGREGESVGKVIRRHEEILGELQREMRGKVNRSEFTAAMSSKLSLSQITNISMQMGNSDQTLKLNQSNQILIHSLEQQLSLKDKQQTEKLQKLNLDWQKRLQYLRTQFQSKHQKILKNLKQTDKELLQIAQKKGDRSELDKIMHLTSLLAIEFQLIKKRFSNFQTDYNLVWKQISNIYSNQETIRTVIDTQQKVKNLAGQEREKKLQLLFRNGQGPTCVNSLFGSVPQSVEREKDGQIEEKIVFDWQEEILRIRNTLKSLERNDEDNSYSVRLFGQRLGVVQNYHQNWFKSLKEIQKTKKQLNQGKEDMNNLHQTHLKLKQQCLQTLSEKVTHQVHIKSKAIKNQIHEACQQITTKMLSVFSKCAQHSDTQTIKDSIQNVAFMCNQKLGNIGTIIKKSQQHNNDKLEYHEQKIRRLQRDLNGRLKIEDFRQQRSQLITSSDVSMMVKKSESSIKGEMIKFSKQQQQINQALCSQNVVVRWVWTSGVLKGGNLVPWDRQIVNTFPQNYIYCATSYCIKVSQGGIYRFELGFYSKKKPSIQILINGQTIISAINSNSYVVHHSSGKLKDITNSQISGLTYQDFFTLLPNSRIAISYTGQIGHGFIGMQRM